jgi:hypothetical protein
MIGLGDVELGPRAAAGQRSHDRVAVEAPGGATRPVRGGGAGDRLRHPLLEALEQAVQQHEPERALQGHPVEARAGDAALAFHRAGEVPGPRPAPDDHVEHRERDEHHHGDDRTDEPQRVTDHAGDELEDVHDQPADPTEHRGDEPADHPEQGHHDEDHEQHECRDRRRDDQHCSERSHDLASSSSRGAVTASLHPQNACDAASSSRMSRDCWW